MDSYLKEMGQNFQGQGRHDDRDAYDETVKPRQNVNTSSNNLNVQ